MTSFTKLYKRLRRLARELAKFGSVGAMAFVVTFGFFNLFRQAFDLGPLTSNAVATIIAATFAYFANRYWTFRHRESSSMGREYVLFFLLNGIGLAITQLFLGLTHYALHLKGGLADNGALIIGTGFATMFRYYAYKRWVFRKAPAKPVVVARVPEMAGFGGPPAPENLRETTTLHNDGVLRSDSGRRHLRQARARVVRAETVPIQEFFR